MESKDLYTAYRYPGEVIAHAVWAYHRFSLSFRDVEDLLAERGVTVSYESIRQWCLKFGGSYARSLRRRPGRPGDTWFLDEVFVTINGERHYLWRAVDQDGDVLDILVQKRRDKRAAKRFFTKLLKGLRYVPRAIVTDKLGSYRAARRELLPSVPHVQNRWRNNRAEVSHQPTRQRERQMRRDQQCDIVFSRRFSLWLNRDDSRVGTAGSARHTRITTAQVRSPAEAG